MLPPTKRVAVVKSKTIFKFEAILVTAGTPRTHAVANVNGTAAGNVIFFFQSFT